MISSKPFFSSSILLLTTILIFVGSLGTVHSGYEPRHPISQRKWSHEPFPISGASGPESLAFDRHGDGPYTGVSDGRIIKWDRNQSRWINFATTTPFRDGCEGSEDHVNTEARCGRPLGLSFDHKTGDLYIADAYMGLLAVGSKGGLATPVVQEVHGFPFKFLNDLVIDQDSGAIYFTDTSTRFERREFANVMFSGDNSGRLLKFDPRNNEVTVLLHNLMFPNGVALSKNGDFLLVAETTNSRILRYWLEPSSKLGKVEVFANLPGRPDNIKRNQNGEFWVAANSEKGGLFNWILSRPRLGNFLARIHFDFTKLDSLFGNPDDAYAFAIRLSENGDTLETIESSEGETLKYISDVDEESGGSLWVGSVVRPFAIKLNASN
nr:protein STRICTOSIDINE SYNTHASE-LIKE 10-like [Coffea arabica]